MGMFDSIRCLYPLPLPKDTGELNQLQFWEYFDLFQTKDLEKCLSLYEIREDGTLWKAICGKKWIPLRYSTKISFYSYYSSDKCKNDYWIEYKALFRTGKLISLILMKFEVIGNHDKSISENVSLPF